MKKMGSRMKGLLTKLPSEYFGESVFIGASTMSTEEIRRRHANGGRVFRLLRRRNHREDA